MKNTFTKLIAIMMSVSLVASCSTNTQNQNTAAGAVTGGVVGGLATGLAGASTGGIVAGVLVGGLIGGVIGHNMDSVDTTHMDQAMANNSTNTSTHWRNSRTHTTYNIKPTSKRMSYKGYSDCRYYTATAMTSNGKKHVYHGVACLQSDGSWQTVR